MEVIYKYRITQRMSGGGPEVGPDRTSASCYKSALSAMRAGVDDLEATIQMEEAVAGHYDYSLEIISILLED